MIQPRIFAAAAIAAGLALYGCSRSAPQAEARLAQALEALQQGRVEESMRLLASIRPAGWLGSPGWTAPLALRLRAQIALRSGVREEALKLLKEYYGRYDGLAPAEYARSRLEFLERFTEWQGQPALLYLRGVEAESDASAVAIREWRNLLRDFPTCSLAPATQLRLGLLQKRLGNAAWALSELSVVSALGPEAVDPDGNPVAPQALLGMGETQADLMSDRYAARQSFEAVVSRFPDAMVKVAGGVVEYLPANMARFRLARLALDGGESSAGVAALEEFTRDKGPLGYYTEELAGDLRAEARLLLADYCLRNRQYSRTRELLIEVARRNPEDLRGPLDGIRRKYAYEAADQLESRLGARTSDEALKGLAEVAAGARSRELWAYCMLKKIKIMARVGQRNSAREALAELEKRCPALEMDPLGDGLVLVPAREARRVLGG